MGNYKQDFILFMLECGVLKFGDFTTKSGRKTPYFVNTGNYKSGAQAAKLGEFYADAIVAHFGGTDMELDFLYGPAYKGIPLAVATAIALHNKHGVDIPYAFNRKEAKDHGEGGTVIGHAPKDNEKVLIIEDVITAGTSVRESVPILKSYGDVSINNMIISVDRKEKGTGGKTASQEVKEEFGIEVFSIVSIVDILELLYGKEIGGNVVVDDKMKARINAYMDEYCVL